MDYLEVLNQRNKLFVILSFLSTILSFISVLGGKLPIDQVLIIMLPMVTLNVAIAFFYKKKYFVIQTMYIVAIWYGILNFITSSSSPSIVNFFVAFYFIVMLSFYQNWKVILITGIFNLTSSVYMFLKFQNTAFKDLGFQNFMPIVIFMILVIIYLIIQSRFSENLRVNLSKLNEKSLNSTKRIEAILNEIRKVIKSANNLNITLKSDIDITNKISCEVTKVFSEITSSIDSLSQNTIHTTNLMQSNNNSVDDLFKASNSMKNLTVLTENVNMQGVLQVEVLANDMCKVNNIVDETVVLIGTLNKETENIGNILGLISGITEQTNLLALNAAIEAARAGEYGRGFAVVAEEIRKLATTSKESIENISTFLKSIELKSDQVRKMIEKVAEASGSSSEITQKVKTVFEQIKANTANLSEQAGTIDALVKSLQKSAGEITNEITAISGTTQQDAASVEEVLESMSEQNQRINSITLSFNELHTLMNDLESIEKHSSTVENE